MIEAYVFFAAFAVQILVVSVLIPARFIRYARGWATNFGSERFAQLQPGLHYGKAIERFVIRFRVAQVVILLVGLVLLGRWLLLTPHPAWASEVMRPAAWYFVLQIAPFLLIAIYAVSRWRTAIKQTLDSARESKRRALLQRRGLFDFVSPFAVAVAVLSYLLFIPFAIYVDLVVYGNASLSKYFYIALAGVTATVVLNVFVIHKQLFGKNNPLMTHEGRVHTIAGTVKSSVYGTIATIWFVAIMSFVTKLQIENWRPAAMSFFFVISMLLGFKGLSTPPRKPDADGPAPDGQLQQRGL